MVLAQGATGQLSIPPEAVGAVVLGLVAAAIGYRRLRPELRRIRSQPVDVHEAAGVFHPVELRGAVEPDAETLEAPFTETECVAHRWRVAEHDAERGAWRELASGDALVPFRVADDTGSVRVEPEAGDVEFRETARIEVGAEESPLGFLRNVGESPASGVPGLAQPALLRLDPDVRRLYAEERLDVGDGVAVYGTVDRDDDASGDWGSGALAATVRRREEDEPLIVSASGQVPHLRRPTLVSLVVLACGLALAGGGGALVLASVLSG